jgi:hypothetical protein
MGIAPRELTASILCGSNSLIPAWAQPWYHITTDGGLPTMLENLSIFVGFHGAPETYAPSATDPPGGDACALPSPKVISTVTRLADPRRGVRVEATHNRLPAL